MQKKFKKSLAVILSLLMIMTMLPMAILPASAAENLDYNITVEVVDWAVYETSGELIGEFNAVEHGDAFYDVSLTQADDGTFTFSYQIALERNGGNTAWDESSISFKIDSCKDEFLQEFEKSFYSNYNIFYNLKVTRSAGHSFSDWADAGDGTHTRTCSVCSETETQNHSFEGGNCLTVGKCVCGLSSIDSNVHTKPVKYVVNSENNFKHDEVYECCGVIKSNLDHKFDSKGMCKECKYQCAHSSFTDSICDFCGYNSVVVVIDGTLGGKTTATEDDVNTLVEQLKGYVDSGITTIIVTGSEPALYNFYGIDTSAVSAALYYLADNNPDSPYCGTIDLILPDVTEIVDDEFNNTFALNSITLPKVTKLGAMAFYSARWLQTITFGSVLTDVNETGGVMFAAVGEDVGGCDLILNCGQMNESSVSAPDLSTNIWKFKHENEFKSITLTHTEGTAATCTAKAVCSVCGESYGEVDADAHSYGDWNSNGDGTHSFTCSICNTAVTESHTMDITTGKCVCGVDMTVIATVTDDTNTYYAADVDTLNEAVTAILEQGSRTFTVELPADAEAEMITAIRRAICDTEGVADGSINLTLKGVTSIPGTTNWDGVAFGPRNAQWDENNVEIVSHEEVTQLASVNLPDATEIGAQAFYFCENLVAVSAPKAQTIGAQALGYTALTSVEFPELTTIPTDMFSGTWTLSSAKFPKVTTIEQGGLLVGAKFTPENNPTPFPLELTAEGDITFNGSNHFNIASQNYSGKVDLVLNIDKKDQVTFNDDGTATWQVRDDLSYTFKSITFTCTDGTTNHSYTYTDNGDGTHDATCSACGAVVDNEPHTIENHVCTDCGAMEIVVSFDAGDYKWETGNQIRLARWTGDFLDDYYFTAEVAEDGTVTWTPDKTLCWNGTDKHTLAVSYPNMDLLYQNFGIPEDQSTLEKLREADCMNAIWSGNPTTDPITFDLKHRLAKVTVNYEIAEGVTVSKAEVYTLTKYMFFDIRTLERVDVAWEEGDDRWINSYHNGNQFTAFVSPDAYAADGNFIKITLDDGTVYEVKMNKAVTFEEGAEYTYTVVITADGSYLTCADECSFEYIANEDGLTHSKVCTECGYVEANENHSLSYSASDNVITESCSKCKATLGTFRIFAPADLYADGITAKEATVENNLVDTSVEISDITYSAPYGLPPKDAGTYTASVTVGGATARVEFTLLNYAAKVTDKDGNAVGTYKTLADAITAASASEGSTVTLLDDVTLTEEQDISSGKFTLDLNGKTLLNETAAAICIESDADVTIKDSGEGGTIESKADTWNTVYNYGTLTVESGIIKGEGGISNSRSGTLNFKSGKIEADTYYAIGNYGTAYIYNGSFKSVSSGAIENRSDSTVYVYGGEFSGSAGIVNHSTAYIEGGEFTGNSYAALNLHGGTVEVTGGSFTGTDFASGSYSGTPYGEYTVYCNEGAALILKGGEFPNGFVVDETTANTFLAENYYYKDADGKLITVSDDAKIINGYVKVSKGADLSDAVITVDKTEFVYNGQHQAPAVTVTIGGKTLKENVDYAVNARRWENGVPVQWFYYVDAGVYTSVITGLGDYTGTVKKEFVIKPATVDIIWEGDVFYYTGNPHKVTAKYVDVSGNEIEVASITNGENTEVGKYIATAVVEDSNYTVNGATINHTYEIKWYDGAPDATVSGTKGENGWYTSAVTVTAPEGYTISTLADGIYGSEITFGNEENAVYYLKQTENGYIAKVELGEIKCDLADPAAEITMAENKWNSFFNTVTFGYFFKETQSITITASDETSGIAKIEYFIATEEITDFENIEWIEYTEKFNIEPNSKNIIYAKATDKAGRYVIVNSDGIVLYTDSQAVTSEATYILTSMEDVEFEIDFNGNEVAYVMCGASYLDNTQYTATENGIKLHANYIEIAYTAGEYQFTVYVDPLGENFGYEGIGYDKYIEPHGDTPETITLTLTVKKLDGNVEITNDISKTYDGKAVSAPEYDIIGTGDVTVEYKVKGADDSTYTTEAPVNAGEYTVRVYVAETGKSTAASATKDFTIAKKAVTVTATAPDKVYDGTTDILEYSKVIVKIDGAVEGEMLGFTVGKAWYDTADAGTDKTVHIIYAPVASNNIDNYEFPINPEYSTDNCYVEAKADISKKAVTVSATVPDRIYGDDYRVDTSKVVITFDGIVEGDDVGYVVTNARYYENTVTDNAHVQVDYNVNGADADNYQFPEFGDWIAPNYGVQATGRVLPRDIANAEITLGDALVYNGAEQTQTVAAVTVDGLEVTYTVSGNKATNVGVYELTITGNGNFAGETTALYEIAPDTTGIDALTVDNVKSSDKEAIEAVARQIENAVTDLADDEKKAEYKAITDKCDELLSKINDTANEIERIDEAVNGYDEETVTSDDIPELGKLIEDIKALTDGDNITEDEKAALEEADKAIDELIEKLAEVAEEIKKVDEAVKSYDEETVKSTDKEDLAQLKEDIQSLIDSDNTTENEKTAFEEMIKDIEGLEDKITETEEKLEEIKDIENNFNPETVSSDDKAAIEDKIAEIEAVNPDNLTDEQREEYEEIKAGLEALLDEIAAAEKDVADIGTELEMFDEERVTKFWEDDIEALKAKINELLADENMGEAEKAKLDEYKAQAEKLIEIINTPKEYFSLRFFYLIWDCLTWKYNGILWLFKQIFAF